MAGRIDRRLKRARKACNYWTWKWVSMVTNVIIVAVVEVLVIIRFSIP